MSKKKEVNQSNESVKGLTIIIVKLKQDHGMTDDSEEIKALKRLIEKHK
jgi:hypothetical protein